MSFNSNLKRIRLTRGLTQQQVADTLGITKATYSGYETGRREPDVFKIKELAKLFGVSGDDLLETNYASQKNSPTPAEPEAGDSDYDALDGYGLSQRDYDLVYTFLVDLGVLSKGQDITRDQIGVLSGVLRILHSTFSPSDVGSKKDEAV